MTKEENRRPVIALTGASGYIGHNLMTELQKDYDIIALSRSADQHQNTEHVTWRSCDFFSYDDAEEALRGADYAIYLIHSMLPSAKLTQGTFEDMDAILAEHFARAAQRNGVKQIVYLSGMIPPDIENKDLSRHLRSRLEVERILGSYDVPVTTLRAGLIVGPSGSSFPILVKLVRRLPVMILPSWTKTPTHTIALADVMKAFLSSLGNEQVYGRPIDIGDPDIMSYQELLRRTGESKEMSYPLIESLAYPMVAQERYKADGISDGVISYEEAAREALAKEEQQEQKKANGDAPHLIKKLKKSMKSDVRSVQRICLPEGKNAQWVLHDYIQWLSRITKPFIRIERSEDQISRIYLRVVSKPILELTYDKARSSSNHASYRISGGSFVNMKEAHNGRLEFLQLPNSRECIVAIHDYLPSLPWFIYKYSQAKLHLWVMKAFDLHLKKLSKNSK